MSRHPASLAELTAPLVVSPALVWLPGADGPTVARCDTDGAWTLGSPMPEDITEARKAAQARRRAGDPADHSQCRSCGADVLWLMLARADGGEHKRHPVDAQPTGKHIVRFGASGRRGKIVDTYQSHFATCPNAAKHRNRNRNR